MPRRISALLLGVVAATAGCAASGGGGVQPLGASPTLTLAVSAAGVPDGDRRSVPPATRTASPLPSTSRRATPPGPGPAPMPDGVWVSYHRMGGFAGLSDEMIVDSSGGVKVSRKGTVVARARLSTAERDHLAAVLRAARFESIPAVSLGRGNDLFTYVVAYQGHIVTTTDGAVPDALRPVLGELDTLFQRYAG